MNVEPGLFVTPNIRLLGELGRGAMGAVWIARHETLGTDVAVKVMQIAAAQRPDIVERFHREAATTAKVRSPHVAQVFDHGVLGNGMPFLVMELLEGEDLGKHLERVGTLTAQELAPILTQLAKALTRAHQSGIVHRDVKPDNLFLSYLDGELLVKVLDFGVAKETGAERTNMTSTGTLLGTPLFMSPEQLLSSRSVDHRSDLWATGVLTYKALTGHFPFVGETLGAVSVAVNDGRFAPPSELRPELPPGVDGWMRTALARDPEQRFQSARELASSFEGVARGEAFVGVVGGAPRGTLPSAGNLAQLAAGFAPRPSEAARSIVPAQSVGGPGSSIAGSTAGVTHPQRSGGSTRAFVAVAVAALALGGGTAVWFGSRGDAPASPSAKQPTNAEGPPSGREASSARDATSAPSPTAAPPEPKTTTPAPDPSPSASPTASQAPRPGIPQRPTTAAPKATNVPPKATVDTIGF